MLIGRIYNRKKLAPVLAAIFMLPLSPQVHAGAGNRVDTCLRILTYNISGLFTPVPNDVVLDAVKALDADLIGFQEVYSVRGLARIVRSDARGTLEESLGEAGYHTYWSSYAGASPGTKAFFDPLLIYEPGNLLAVRRDKFKLLEPASEIQLSYYSRALGLGRENRVLQHITLRWKERQRRIDFYNTHLTHRGRRVDNEDTPLMNEVREVRRALAEYTGADAAIVFTADINLVPGNLGYRLLKEGNGKGPALIDTWETANPGVSPRPATLDPRNTFFSKHSFFEKVTGDTGGPPPLHLDYVFIGPEDRTDLEVHSSEVVLDQLYEGDNYSDHYGVVSKVCMD